MERYEDSQLYRIRHSAAHVMAQAVREIFPDACVEFRVSRALLGSFERFVGILLEFYGGALPVWLSPVQVGVASVSEKSAVYAREVTDKLMAGGLRAELDDGDEKIGPKKHRFRAEKVNYILVVGEQEAAYFGALARVATWSFREERLELRAADGALQVEFRAVEGSLEGESRATP